MKTILVALDGSPNAPNVLRGARELAEKVGAELLLFHAVSLPMGLPREAYAISPTDVGPLLLETARQQLEGYANDLRPTVRARVRVQYGVPWQAICEGAKGENVDLIAVGSHGYGGLDRVLGTTAAKVVDHADRSVLVLRAPALVDELLAK
jgi:nucleotide-binding universal stress UspA family protein